MLNRLLNLAFRGAKEKEVELEDPTPRSAVLTSLEESKTQEGRILGNS